MNTDVIKRFLAFNNKPTDQEMRDLFHSSISYNNNPSTRLLKKNTQNHRVKREDSINKLDQKTEPIIQAHEQKTEDEEIGPANHSAIGVTLVIGFIFMLIVDQIGGKVSHRHLPSLFFLENMFFL